MMMRVAGMEGVFHGFACHDFGSWTEGDLFLIQNEGMGEDFSYALELVMGGDDEMAGIGEVEQAVGKVASAFDIESVEGFVEEENVGLLGKGAGDVSALLLATGELVDLPVGNVVKIHRGDGLFGFLAVDFIEATEVSDVGEASHGDDVAHANREVPLVAIDLGKIGDFTAESYERLFAPVELAFLGFE